MFLRSESLAVYSCIRASVSSRDGKPSLIRCSRSRISSFAGRIGRRGRPGPSEIYEALAGICREQLYLDLVPNVDALLAAHQSSFHGWVDHAHVGAAGLVAGDDCLEAL